MASTEPGCELRSRSMEIMKTKPRQHSDELHEAIDWLFLKTNPIDNETPLDSNRPCSTTRYRELAQQTILGFLESLLKHEPLNNNL